MCTIISLRMLSEKRVSFSLVPVKYNTSTNSTASINRETVILLLD